MVVCYLPIEGLKITVGISPLVISLTTCSAKDLVKVYVFGKGSMNLGVKTLRIFGSASSAVAIIFSQSAWGGYKTS